MSRPKKSKIYSKNKVGYSIPIRVDEEEGIKIAQMFVKFLGIYPDMAECAKNLDTTVSEIKWYLETYLNIKI